MADNTENLVLQMLRRLDTKVDRVIETLNEHGRRLLTIESSVAAVRRDQAGDAETVVHMQARLDRLQEQIDRINRRLDIAE